MVELYTALREYAEDSSLEIIAYDRQQLRLRLALDSEAGKQYILLIPEPVHLDMPPVVILGKIEFGNKSLLPVGYAEPRYRGYEGDEGVWRVMRVTDDEENRYFVIYVEKEAISEETQTHSRNSCHV